eukprot:s2897_g4.t1
MQLKLDPQELAAYGSILGNILRACPCKCRGPISDALLKAQGLHGVLVKSAYPAVGCRHLHPMEAAVLLGVSADLKMGPDLCGLLTQLGQIASPIQSHWMLSHFWTLFGLIAPCDLPQIHEQLVQDHVRRHARMWTPPNGIWPRTLDLILPEGASLSLRLSGPTRYAALLTAEAALGREIESLCLRDAFGPLNLHDRVIGLSSELCSRSGGGSDLDLRLRCLGLDDLLMTREGLALISQAGLSPLQFLMPRNLASLLDMWPEAWIFPHGLSLDLLAVCCSWQLFVCASV